MLTDTVVKALKPQRKLYKVSDRDGMYVVVQPSGAIVFQVRLSTQRMARDADARSIRLRRLSLPGLARS